MSSRRFWQLFPWRRAVLFVFAAYTLPPLYGASFLWNGSSSVDWATAANWTPAGVPGTQDIVVFTGDAVANCVMGANREVGSVSITTGFAGKTLDLQGYTLTVNPSSTLSTFFGWLEGDWTRLSGIAFAECV